MFHSFNVSFAVGLDNFDNVLKTYCLAKAELGEILSSCEMIDRLSLEVCTKYLRLQNPLTSGGDGHNFYVLIETAGSQLAHDEEKLNSFVEKAMNEGIIADGTLSSEPSKMQVSISVLKFRVILEQ